MSDYRAKLWDEIARNSPPTAKWIADMNKNFNSRLRTFRWIKEPRVVLCTYKPIRREVDEMPEELNVRLKEDK